MAERWLLFSIITLASWGVWGVALKAAAQSLSWRQLYVFSGLATAIAITALALAYRSEVLSTGPKAALAALGAGSLGTLGYLSMVNALDSGGEASVVVPLTSLYPAVTAVVAYLALGEPLTKAKVAGIALAIAAAVLLSRSG
ncbi:MAG: EamA family transporter [Thermoproteota archaeon]